MRYFNFILTIAFFFIGYKRDTISSSAKLVGQWELKSSIGGINGGVINYPTDQGNILVLGSSTYKETRNRVIIREGTYTTKRETSIISQKEEDRIIFDNSDPSVRVFFSMDGDILKINQDAFDGVSVSYKKMK